MLSPVPACSRSPGLAARARPGSRSPPRALLQPGREVAWVELGPVEDPAIVGPAVAGRLGVPEIPGLDSGGAISAHVVAQFADRPLLVVLDNCEHLAGAVAELTEHLLADCPALSVLATSREPLGVEGERSWPVPPLDGTDAMRLFEDRARLVAPSFCITDANRGEVAEVCAKLDRLPLAIELAAARVRILSIRQLAERLDDVFGVLTGGARSAPARHQALRATLDWSHDLLAADERAVFRRLAVFSGGFTLAAAERVAGFGDITAAQVLDLLAKLADKSLLQVDRERYHLLATIHEYAREWLAASGEADQARRVHLAYYTGFAEETGPRVDRAPAAGLEGELDVLDLERSNLRAASDFARQSADAIAALRIAGQLGRYAYLRGHYQEIRHWMDLAVTVGPDAPAGLRARALLGSGRLAYLQCDYEPAVRRLDAALLLYRSLSDASGIAACLQALGSVAREQGRYARSAQLHSEARELARACADERAEASARNYLGFVSWLQGDFGLAATECTAALAMFRVLGDVEGTAWSLISLGVVARCQGDVAAARALLRESLTLSESIGFREGIAWSLEQLGLLELAGSGDAPARRFAAAEETLRRSFETHRELRDRWRMSSLLEDLAATALADTASAAAAGRAAAMLGAAQALREAIGTVIAPSERPQHDAVTASERRLTLGEDCFLAGLAAGAGGHRPGGLARRARRGKHCRAETLPRETLPRERPRRPPAQARRLPRLPRCACARSAPPPSSSATSRSRPRTGATPSLANCFSCLSRRRR